MQLRIDIRRQHRKLVVWAGLFGLLKDAQSTTAVHVASLTRDDLLQCGPRFADRAAASRIFGPSPAIERKRRIHCAAPLAGPRCFAGVVLLCRFSRIDETQEQAITAWVGIVIRGR